MTRLLRSAALVAALLFVPQLARAADEASIKRGEYLFNAGGCDSCHTDRKANIPKLAGGPAIKTPFGTFYGPNITPHMERGVGKWSDDDFLRAMRQGIGPDGTHFFPVFPYTSFTNMTDADAKDLRAYLATVPASDRPSKPHDVSFPFNLRILQAGWRALNFMPGPFKPDASKSAEWNRGAYLVTALAHCGECHTPRTRTGGIEHDKWFAGNADGPGGDPIPNITPDKDTGIGGWSEDDIIQYLSLGLTPDGDVAGSLMGEVIEFSTSKLTDADRKAIAVYVKSLPPIRNAVKRQ